MSGRVAYLERADRGGRLRRVRLIAGRGESAWASETRQDDPALAIAEDARRAADWIAGELGKGSKKQLAAICLDPDGAVCSWLSAPTGEASALAATIQQAGVAEPGGLDAAPIEHGMVAAAAFGPDAQIPGGATIEALTADRPNRAGHAEPERLAVVAAPDTPARLLLDRLDQIGLSPDHVLTLWHAMARAWTPDEQAEPEIAGVVLVEPNGRVSWCWSRGGALLAAGRLRIAPTFLDHPASAAAAVSRLNAEWLAWSAQLGVSPARVACVTPEREDDEPSPLDDADDFAAALARGVRRAWPSAHVELATLRDPVGATLRQLLATDAPTIAGGDGAHALSTLSARPGRAHRGMYRWLSAAITIAAVLLILVGWRLRTVASEAREQAAALDEEQRDLIRAYSEDIANARSPLRDLNQRRNDLAQAAQTPSGVQPMWPVVSEVDAITPILAFGVEDVELVNLNINQLLNRIEVTVPNLVAYETLLQSLRGLPSDITWDSQTERGRDDRLKVIFTGVWPVSRASTASASPRPPRTGP